MSEEFDLSDEAEDRLARLGERYLNELHDSNRNPDLQFYLRELETNREKDLFVDMAKTIVGFVADIHVIERRKERLPPTLNPAKILAEALRLDRLALSVN